MELFGEGGAGRGSRLEGKGVKIEKRKWFVDKTRNCVEIVKRKLDGLGKAETDVVQAVMQMNQQIICYDECSALGVLETLAYNCPIELCEGLIAEDSKKDSNNLEWAIAEKFILGLVSTLPQISTMIKVWLIHLKFEKEFDRVCKL